MSPSGDRGIYANPMPPISPNLAQDMLAIPSKQILFHVLEPSMQDLCQCFLLHATIYSRSAFCPTR